jgi:excinuclease ABC subunit A
MTIDALRMWMRSLDLTPFEGEIAHHVLREANDRVTFLCDVGLGYITMDRTAKNAVGRRGAAHLARELPGGAAG